MTPTRLISVLLLFKPCLLAACAGEPEDPIAAKLGAVDYRIVGEGEETPLLDPTRDPEGDQITGEPDGPASQDATNDDGGVADPMEEIDEDAQPSP